MLLQFEFLTERARKKLVERQDQPPAWVTYPTNMLPDFLEFVERMDGKKRPAGTVEGIATPIEPVDPLILVDGKGTPIYMVQDRVDRLVGMAAELAANGWTSFHDRMILWRNPDKNDKIHWTTESAYARMIERKLDDLGVGIHGMPER